MTQIFIGGTGRSGTTILGKILSYHPDIAYLGESKIITNGGCLYDFMEETVDFDTFTATLMRSEADVAYALELRGYDELKPQFTGQHLVMIAAKAFPDKIPTTAGAREFLEAIFGTIQKTTRKLHWMEKSPHVVRRLDLMQHIYPTLRMVHTLRDPRDVYCSAKQYQWGPQDPEYFIGWYKRVMEPALEYHLYLPSDNCLAVSLETLTAAPRETLRAIVDFIGLELGEGQLGGMSRLITKREAHQRRFEKEIPPEDAKAIFDACGPLYERWLEVEKGNLEAYRAVPFTELISS